MQQPRPSRSPVDVFDRAASTYDNVGVPWFTPIAAELVRQLAAAPGERALDVGCGRGAALFPLADAVGPAGRVSGIDLAPRMVEATAADVRARHLDHVDVRVMDAAAPEFEPASFDLLASSLVLFFLPAPGAALSAWYELLVPGGRLGVSTFGPRDPHWIAVDDVFTPYLPAAFLDARTSGTTGPFGSDEGMESLFSAAGLTDLRTVSREVPVRFSGADRWREWSMSHGQRAMWDSVPPDRSEDVAAEAARRLEAARDPGGTITLTQTVRYTLGRRPPERE